MLFEQITQFIDHSTPKDLHLRSVIENNLMLLIQQFALSTHTRFTDWRLDLLTHSITIGASRSFHDAFQATILTFHEVYLLLLLTHLEKHNFIDAYHFLSNIDDTHVQEHLSKLWLDCLNITMEKIDLSTMNLDQIEIQLNFDLKLPCATIEYENIRSIRENFQQIKDNNESFDCCNYIFDRIHSISVYKEDFMELVSTDHSFFKLYCYDQISLHLGETIIQLSPVFVYELLTSNPNRSFKQYMRLFLADHVEFTQILRLFELSLQLTNEEEILTEFRKQLIENPINEIRSSKFYTLVLANEQFYQLPPKTTTIEGKRPFKCKGDPMIETSLMNLIELILSPSVIDRANHIQQITTIYSLIAHGVRTLPSYLVNNLERLRTFISLIRCLTTLIPNKALEVFKDICKQGFDGKFDSCSSIHRFIGDLRKLISISSENIAHRTLVKLELEFLKDWLVDNGDSYDQILILMNKQDNDLWRYSAKIFTYIDRKLNLLSALKKANGKMTLIEKYQQLNRSLTIDNIITRKVERLIVNRLHMHLMLEAQGNKIDQQLIDSYSHFEKNLLEIKSIKNPFGIQLISLLAWLKYYAQMYGFALNNDSNKSVLSKIDQLLCKTDTPFCSTLKLFILKQLLQMSELNLDQLREVYVVHRRVEWIQPFLQCYRNQQTQDARRKFVLPSPLFECREQFEQVSQILNNIDDVNALQHVINECKTTQSLSYAFLCWFIQYYGRFTLPNTEIDKSFVQLIEHELSQDLICSFTQLGHRFLISICSNFSNNSYFHLRSIMTPTEIHQRFLALNIAAIFISFKALPEITHLGNILFDAERQLPADFVQHLSTLCLPGLTISDPVITQMIDVRTQIQERLDRGEIYTRGRFIFQCSRECPWMFYFQNCGVPNDRSECPLCKKQIGAEQYNVLIERNPPQIRMSIDEGFQTIKQHIDQYNQTARLGYYNVKTVEMSTLGEKPDHLNRSVSFRFIHFLTHGLFLVLHNLKYLTNGDINDRLKLPAITHFRDHFEKDYILLTQTSTDNQQCYIWLYKLLNHLVNEKFAVQGLMNTNESVFQIEQLIEQNLIFEHIDQVDNEVIQYKMAYAQFIQERNSEIPLKDFIDELYEDEQQFPHLKFFNVTKFHTSNPLDEFILKIQTLPYAEQTYPVTRFLLRRLDDYTNIQHLYAIIVFTNYLIEKFNHRIKRYEAAEKKIIDYLNKGDDGHITQALYDDFLHGWYSLNLNKVRYGCQTLKFERTVSKNKFAENTSIAMLLLNTSKDESSLLLAACLKTIAELQNDILNYFYNTVEQNIETEAKRKCVSLQAIRPEHILRLDRNELSKKLINDSLILNYEYGKSKDVIYDYEEIEITLRNMISSLVLIDTDKLRFLNYQFELYAENVSLINDVRARIKQKRLANEERTKLFSLIDKMNNDDIINYLGSLDYIFTYLRNSVLEKAAETMTIAVFVEQHIHSHACLNENVLRRQPFSNIQLQYIIDLCEMLEEIAFDKVLRQFVKKELAEESFSDEEQKRVVSRFSSATFEKETIAVTIKTIDCWIAMLKRLIIRVLNANISLDVPLQLYLERTDLWNEDVYDVDLATFEVDITILLKHTYVILVGLERKQKAGNMPQQQLTTSNDPNSEDLGRKVDTWFNEAAEPTNVPIVVADDEETEEDEEKIRV